MTKSNVPGKRQSLQSRNFNYIYSKIVVDEKDFIGMVAYSNYKKEKIKFILEYSQNNNGQPIPESELEKFHQSVSQPWSIDGFKQKAKEELEVFFDILLENHIETIKQAEKDAIHEYYQQHIANISDEIKKQDKSYWYGIGQEIVGSFAVVFVIAALVFIPTALKLGPTDAFEAITGWEIRKKDAAQNKSDTLNTETKPH